MGEHRVVILARDGDLPPPNPQTLGMDVSFVRVSGGYEAAAELLAQSSLALLIDLAYLTPPHRKLLHVARQLGVEVLGVGSFPPGLSAGDLSGMRLISMADLPATLRAIAPRAVAQTAASAKPPSPEASSMAPAVAAALRKEGVQLTPRKADYKPTAQEQPRPSRIISPAKHRDPNHPTGRTGQ